MAIAKSSIGSSGSLTIAPVYTVPALKRTVSNIIISAVEGATIDLSILDTEFSYSGADLNKSIAAANAASTGTTIYWSNVSAAFAQGVSVCVDKVAVTNGHQSYVHIYDISGPFDSSSGQSLYLSAPRSLKFSKDGRFLAVVNSSSQVYVYTRQSNGNFTQTTSEISAAQSTGDKTLAFSDDGSKLIIGRNNSTVEIYADQGGGSFSLEHTISNPSGASGFAYSVAVSGDNIFVGAYNTTVSGNSGAGLVYHYSITSGSPSLVRTIEPPNLGANIQFGWAIAASGNLLVASSPQYNNNSGIVYVFDIETGTRTQTLGSPHSGGLFGKYVAIDGDIISAISWTVSSYYSYLSVYYWNGSSFSSETTNLNLQGGTYAYWGSLDINGAIIATGSSSYDSSSSNRGAFFVYKSDNALASMQSILNAQGAAMAAGQLDKVTLSAGDTFERTGLVLDAGEIVTMRTNGKVVAHVRGYEEDV